MRETVPSALFATRVTNWASPPFALTRTRSQYWSHTTPRPRRDSPAPREQIDHPLDGSGFLVSEDDGLLMTACSFGSSKWAHWNDNHGTVILRASAGRFHDPRAAALGQALFFDTRFSANGQVACGPFEEARSR